MNGRDLTIPALLLAFVLVACGGDEPADSGGGGGDGGTTPATGTTTGTTTTPADTSAATAADSPLGAFERIKAAVAAGDYAALYDLLSADVRSSLEAQIGKARELVKAAEGKAPMAVELAKSQLGEQYGFSYDDLVNRPTRELGGKMIGKAFGDRIPGVFKGEVQGEPAVGGDTATLVVTKPNGKTEDLEMVKEDDGWKLRYEP